MATNYGYSKHCNGCAKIITPTHLKQFEGSYNVWLRKLICCSREIFKDYQIKH